MAKILILESDRQLGRHMAEYLGGQGYEVVSFGDPQSAITNTDSSCPDIIILDLSLAGRSGIEFLYELRSFSDWQAVPVIVTGRLSLDEQAASSQAFGQLNVSRYLPKDSTSLSDLSLIVSQLLQPARA